MFSFHKPKIYRSLKGCCICRAKSSSSRFTDSKRYEADFEKCFWIEEERSGEICNACVLLVKRWKKLPPGSNRNWHHVVDARAGPGTKSIMKIKSRNKEERRVKKKHKHKKACIIRPPQSPGGLSDDVIVDDLHSDHSSRSGISSEASDISEDDGVAPSPRKDPYSSKGRRKKDIKPTRFSSFLDLTYWKKTEICCGIIFKGPNGEVLVDTTLLRPCRTCKTPPRVAACSTTTPVPLTPDPAIAMTPQILEASPAPGSPMEADSASSVSIMGTASRSSSPPPQMAQTAVPTPTSLAISTAVSAVLDLSMPVHKSTAINLMPHRCIEMEV